MAEKRPLCNYAGDTKELTSGDTLPEMVATHTHAATSKTTPVDADEIPLADSAASFVLKKLTWANLKATFVNTINAFTQPQSITVNSASAALRVEQQGTGNAIEVFDAASDTTPFVVDAAGRAIQGAASSISVGGVHADNQINSFGFGNSYSRWVNDANGIFHKFLKSRSTTPGVAGAVTSGDALYYGQFYGDDGTSHIEAVRIAAGVDGTVATGDVPGRLIFYTKPASGTLTERLRIDSNGCISAGSGGTLAGRTLYLSRPLTGSTSVFSVSVSATVQSDATAAAANFASSLAVADAAFTLPALTHYRAAQSTIGASATVTNQYGYYADATMTGASNNYGFYGNIASGTGRWNFYASGTANNAYAGNSRFGGTTAPTVAVDVTGAVLATTSIKSSGATSGIGYTTGAGGTVTQSTSKSTGVTLNKVCGAITLNAASLAADTTVSFVLTNSAIAAGDILILNHTATGAFGSYNLNARAAAGSATIDVRNITTGALAEAIVISFSIIKAVTA